MISARSTYILPALILTLMAGVAATQARADSPQIKYPSEDAAVAALTSHGAGSQNDSDDIVEVPSDETFADAQAQYNGPVAGETGQL